MYRFFLKRFFDIILSLVAIILLIPTFLFLYIIVLIKMGRPVFFSQERIGKDNKVFKLYKFRTMTNLKDADGKLLPEKDRLTKFGTFLRSSSLDELPELFAILLGKMSIVGPRPLPTYYKPYFFPDELVRHKVRGGLIPPDGLSGETIPTWEKQFEYDVFYAEKVSFLLDCKIVFVTFKILFKRLKSNYGAEERPHLNIYRAYKTENTIDVKKSGNKE